MRRKSQKSRKATKILGCALGLAAAFGARSASAQYRLRSDVYAFGTAPSPAGLVVLDAGLGQELGSGDARFVDVGLPQSVGERDAARHVKPGTPALDEVGDHRDCHAQIGAVGLVIGRRPGGAVGIARRAELVQRLFGRHSTVTDFARLRGWSTSVPLAQAV